MGRRSTSTTEDRTIRQRLSDLENRVRRLELWMVAIVVATASPKVGGPDPSQFVGAVFRHLV